VISNRKVWSGCALLVILVLSSDQPVRSDEPKAVSPVTDKPRRRVYLLHSGLHTILSDPAKNIAAETLKEGLRKRGVAEKDLIVLENPFPYASWKSLLPFESLTMFFEAAEPSSKMSHDAYLRMHKALRAHGVGRTDDVVWIGHSAGGQIGMTMAHLARNLWKFPDLAKETSAYQFDMVITLGAPLESNYLPPEVKLRNYYSAEDVVVRWVAKIGPWVAYPLGYPTRIGSVPARFGANCMIRCFGGIEHPYWDVDGRVLDRILGETVAGFRPAWHARLGVASWGLSLGEFMCRALEGECQVSFEDPPRNK